MVRMRLADPAAASAAASGSWTPRRTARSSRPADAKRPLELRTTIHDLRTPHRRRPRSRCWARWASTRSTRLFSDIPPAVRADGLDLPRRLDELALARRLGAAVASRNRVDLVSFLGAGAYRHHIPPTVDQILSRGEFYTAYTPYQPEISQGTLQTIYEYQSLIAELTGLDVVSASHYDGAAATAEAALMTVRADGSRRVLVEPRRSTATTSTRRATYFEGGRLELEELPTLADGTTDLAALERALADAGDPVAGVVLGQPNAFGVLEPMAEAARLAHAAGALFVAVVEPVSLAVLAPPGEYGADIARRRGTAAGHRAAVRRPVPGHPRRHDRDLIRQIPGRLVGRTHRSRRPARLRDDASRARAGHPPRQGGQQHLHQPGAVRAGGDGLSRDDRSTRPARRGGRRRRAARAARARARGRRGAARPHGAYLNEFAVRVPDAARCPRRAPRARRRSRGCRSRAGIPDDPELRDALLVCATEVTTDDDIERFAAALLVWRALRPRLTAAVPSRARPWRRASDRRARDCRAQTSGRRRSCGRRVLQPTLAELSRPAAAAARSRTRRPTRSTASRRPAPREPARPARAQRAGGHPPLRQPVAAQLLGRRRASTRSARAP